MTDVHTLFFFFVTKLNFLFCVDGASGKNLPVRGGAMGSIPGLGRSPRGGHGNPSIILAWRIPWIEEPDGLQSTGSQRDRTEATSHAQPVNNVVVVSGEE